VLRGVRLNPLLESALFKLRWAANSGCWSVDITGDEASALLEEFERMSEKSGIEIQAELMT
jgi:hypothetical protein